MALATIAHPEPLPAPPAPGPRGQHKQLALPGVPVAQSAPAPTAPWQGAELTGRIVELSGSTGRSSTAVSMLLAKQRQGEAVVWIEPTDGCLYPPDLAAAGVDLDALVIVRVPAKEGPEGLCRVAEWLVRSGGFGLLVMDLMGRTPAAHNPWQSRLSGLLRKHDAQLCVLSDTDAAAPSLGALVALRLEPQRRREDDGSFVLEQRVLKNKVGLLSGPSEERRRAPAGLETLPAVTADSDHHAQLSLFEPLGAVAQADAAAAAAAAAASAELLRAQPLLPGLEQVAAGSVELPAVTRLPQRAAPPPVVLRTKVAAKRVSLAPGASAELGPAAGSGTSADTTPTQPSRGDRT